MPYNYDREYLRSDVFRIQCAKFRRFATWEGDILKLDYEALGKDLFRYYYKMTDEERQAFFDLDLMVALINRDIKPTPSPSQWRQEDEESVEQQEAIKKAINQMWSEGTLLHKYDHTWIMMTMNETEWLPSVATPTEYLDYMEKCGVRDRLPDRSTMSKYYDKARGTFPTWTFTDAKDKEEIRRNNAGKRFLNLIQRA